MEKMTEGKILLSFDVEEFDLVKEYNGEISVEDGVEVSSGGLIKILKLLREEEVKATFFVTGNFVRVNPKLVREIMKDGHEVACHGVDHFESKKTDIAESKKIVEKAIGKKVAGYRQPRMFEISYLELGRCGYQYDSSVNPAFVPGRYNHFNVPRKPFLKEGVLEIPTSVATCMRVPLFWLSLHLFSKKMYLKMAKMAVKKTGYFAAYFHPWEFSDELATYGQVPGYIKKNSGDELVERLRFVISELKSQGYEFETYDAYTAFYTASLDKS